MVKVVVTPVTPMRSNITGESKKEEVSKRSVTLRYSLCLTSVTITNNNHRKNRKILYINMQAEVLVTML